MSALIIQVANEWYERVAESYEEEYLRLTKEEWETYQEACAVIGMVPNPDYEPYSEEEEPSDG